MITLHHYQDTYISTGGAWFIVRKTGSAGIHQRSDTPNRPFLRLLETAYSTAFPGMDHVCCELFIAQVAHASANAWICSETEWDACCWYCLKTINSDIHVATCGQVWSRLRRWPRSLLSNQEKEICKWSWDVAKWKSVILYSVLAWKCKSLLKPFHEMLQCW